MSDKRHGNIQTDKSYNDRAETELAFEHFEFNGHRISLPHSLDEDGYRNHDYVSIETPSEYSIYIYPNRIEVVSPAGFTEVAETYTALVAKCRIADKLAAVNQWNESSLPRQT